MSSSSARADGPVSPIDIRGPRVSTVVVQRVAADRVERFIECQHGLAQAAAGFAGYQGTELYPPADDQHDEWVAVIHFDNHQALNRWIDSPVRTLWVKKVQEEIGEFQLKTLPSGFGAWFAGFATGTDGQPPPSWKIAMTVLLGLYPTVMVLFIFVGPYVNFLGIALAMLVSNVLSVALTQWVVIPPLMYALGPWLKANTADRRSFSLGGLVLVWLLLVGLARLFRIVTG